MHNFILNILYNFLILQKAKMKKQSTDKENYHDLKAKTIYRSAMQSKGRTSIIKNNVHFQSEVTQLSSRQQGITMKKKQSYNLTINDQLLRKATIKKNTCIQMDRKYRYSQKNMQVMKTLSKLQSLKLPRTIRKFYGQTNKIIGELLNSPILTRHSIMNQYKCFMSNLLSQDSNLISKRLILKGKQKLKQLNNQQQIRFGYDSLAQFIKKVQQKCNDSFELLQSFEAVRFSQKYPPSVQLMILYIGVFLYEINSNYQKAEELCKNLLDYLIKYRLDQYILIYLILMIKMKSNLNDWQSTLGLISKLLSASWLYKLQDLQIWCYFQFSRAYFSANNYEACQYFKQRSEMSILEISTVFRDMMEKEYSKQVQLMRNHNYNFNLTKIIQYSQLTELPLKQNQSSSLKAQVYAKSIIQNFKIKHVKNLIGRLGQDIGRGLQDIKQSKFGGNPHFLTHQSGIKNLNIYFRQKKGRSKCRNFYTFENSNRNGLVLKQMLKFLLIQMKWFVPIVD